jgi:hypothetical protein
MYILHSSISYIYFVHTPLYYIWRIFIYFSPFMCVVGNKSSVKSVANYSPLRLRVEQQSCSSHILHRTITLNLNIFLPADFKLSLRIQGIDPIFLQKVSFL